MTTTQQNCCWHALTLHSFSYLTCTNCDSNIQCSFSYTRKHRNKHLETNKSCTMREVPKKFKDLRKVGVRNIVQCSAANVQFAAGFFSTDIHFFHTTAMFTGACGPPEKLSLLWCRARTFCAWLRNSLIGGKLNKTLKRPTTLIKAAGRCKLAPFSSIYI